MSCRAGTATRISCRCSRARASCRKPWATWPPNCAPHWPSLPSFYGQRKPFTSKTRASRSNSSTTNRAICRRWTRTRRQGHLARRLDQARRRSRCHRTAPNTCSCSLQSSLKAGAARAQPRIRPRPERRQTRGRLDAQGHGHRPHPDLRKETQRHRQNRRPEKIPRRHPQARRDLRRSGRRARARPTWRWPWRWRRCGKGPFPASF